jgi:hypothetical protein
MLESRGIWNAACLGVVIERRVQTITNVAAVLFYICKEEEPHVIGLYFLNVSSFIRFIFFFFIIYIYIYKRVVIC